jgi:hypothetical protein
MARMAEMEMMGSVKVQMVKMLVLPQRVNLLATQTLEFIVCQINYKH